MKTLIKNKNLATDSISSKWFVFHDEMDRTFYLVDSNGDPVIGYRLTRKLATHLATLHNNSLNPNGR